MPHLREGIFESPPEQEFIYYLAWNHVYFNDILDLVNKSMLSISIEKYFVNFFLSNFYGPTQRGSELWTNSWNIINGPNKADAKTLNSRAYVCRQLFLQ